MAENVLSLPPGAAESADTGAEADVVEDAGCSQTDREAHPDACCTESCLEAEQVSEQDEKQRDCDGGNFCRVSEHAHYAVSEYVDEDAGRMEAAMDWFINADKYAEQATDERLLGRLYKIQSLIYADNFNHDLALASAKKSAKHYLAAKDIDKYAGVMDDVALYYNVLNYKDSCDMALDRIKPHPLKAPFFPGRKTRRRQV